MVDNNLTLIKIPDFLEEVEEPQLIDVPSFLKEESFYSSTYCGDCEWCESSCERGTTCQVGECGQCGSCEGCMVCMSPCQHSEQDGCTSGCEQNCQQNCEIMECDYCEEACQAQCEEHCQSGCQRDCQTTCEKDCQSTCQSSCQSACQKEYQWEQVGASISISSITSTSARATITVTGDYANFTVKLYQNGIEMIRDTNTASITYSGLTPRTSYVVQVEVEGKGGDWFDTTSSFTTKAPESKPDITSHSASYSVVSADSDYCWVGVSFNANYATDYSVSLSGNGTDSGSMSGSSKYVEFSNVRRGQTYTYNISVSNSVGTDSASGSITVPAKAVPQVTLMQITGETSSTLSVWAETIGDVDGFKWYVGGAYKTSTTTGSVTITGLQQNTQYTIGCIPHNNAGEGDMKTIDAFTTADDFYWSVGWFNKGDQAKKLTADEWNSFLDAVRSRYKKEFGFTPSLNNAQKGGVLTALNYNKLLEVLRQLDRVGQVPTDVRQRQIVEAENHINQIVRAFNESL